jgi:hypothetical protein
LQPPASQKDTAQSQNSTNIFGGALNLFGSTPPVEHSSSLHKKTASDQPQISLNPLSKKPEPVQETLPSQKPEVHPSIKCLRFLFLSRIRVLTFFFINFDNQSIS